MQIKFSDVTYTYKSLDGKNTDAIQNIKLDLSGHSLVAIVGHTGSGKSTAMQHINGLLQPTSGQMEIDDFVITNKKNRRLAEIRKNIGYVFQNPAYQLFSSSVLEDVMYGPINFGFSEEKAKEVAEKALDIVGVDKSLFGAYPFALSGGQMRKVALAGALAYNPRVLILDEPTVGLDPLATEQLITLIQKLYEEEQKSLVFITHDMEFVYKVAQRVVVFSEGKVVFDGSPMKLFSDAQLLKKYALDMPTLFELAHSLRERGLPIQIGDENFTFETILESLQKIKGIDKK